VSILSSRRAKLAALIGTAWLSALIPFSCGQGILRAVTPVLLDDTRNALDALIGAVAPFVLP
jgi:hypothetical protein